MTPIMEIPVYFEVQTASTYSHVVKQGIIKVTVNPLQWEGGGWR